MWSFEPLKLGQFVFRRALLYNPYYILVIHKNPFERKNKIREHSYLTNITTITVVWMVEKKNQEL